MVARGSAFAGSEVSVCLAVCLGFARAESLLCLLRRALQEALPRGRRDTDGRVSTPRNEKLPVSLYGVGIWTVDQGTD